jgi:allophanate hydrolase subunit 2
MLGPHADWFEPVAIERLLAERFVVGGTSNRMAFRLAGPDLPWRAVREMVSEPTACGHVQVPPSGVPMLLMADRQTVGGYPTIATVIGADLGVAAQLAPGDGLRFVSCDRATAIRALLRREQRLVSASGDRARRPRRPPSADDSREATDPERFPGGEDSPGQ